MFEMYVKDTPLEPVGLGVTKVGEGEQEKLVLTFQSQKDFKEVQPLFTGLEDTDVIMIKNEKRELTYTGFTEMESEASIKVNADGTYSYQIILNKPSALSIVLKNKADIEYMAVMSNVDIEA